MHTRFDRRFKFRCTLPLVLALAVTGCATMSSVLFVVFFWIMMIPFIPFIIVTAPLYILNDSDTGVIATSFAPDGSHMLVTYRDNDTTTIYRVGFHGDNVEALTSGESFDFDPEYSPDGSLIAFSRRSKQRVSHLRVMNADGSDVRQITFGRREDFTPQFSPDGTRIVFPSYMLRKQADLFVVDLETGVERRLTDATDSHDVGPLFLPDGNTVLFSRAGWYGHYSPIASSDWHDYDLYAIPAAGGEPTRLSNKKTYGESTLRVAESVDRRFVMYDGQYVEMDKVSFDSLAAKGVQYLQLESFPEALSGATVHDVSPDLRYVLAFNTEKGEAWDNVLFVVDLEQNERRAVIRYERTRSILDPKFTPDGRQVLYRIRMQSQWGKTHESLWITSLDGGTRRIDTALPGVPEWTEDVR